MMLANDIPSVVFVAVLAWGIFRNDRQLDTSASWGRQLFGRWKNR
jgi:hypothetical protein